MKRIIALLSLILVLSAFCGCSGPPVGFQDVENIATVDFMFDDGGKYNYSFDLESGVFSADCLDESTEYVLEQTEIEAIRAAIEPAGKWPGDFRYSSAGYNYPQRYNMVITYADGTECVLTGVSSNGSNWPEGFEELKSTLDGIVQARVYGSFTVDKTYSYDGAYYALITEEDKLIVITIYSSDEDEVYSFKPCGKKGFWGICWDNDNYDLWIQLEDVGALCYSMTDEIWTLNDDAKRPEYITGGYVFQI